ncbi:uncharacterized protein LOC113513972 isoform X2 [Galleria mellonella]|uniref:Uncharacterized protein LOC113513972 isoform X2 n=1 Tax=Galleria mellonella TaxID=7137 RepID=A0ABM3MAR1_GALME|nr:uncharacterized protein LOC113513972 isoform X2 [Galleria mellonella]
MIWYQSPRIAMKLSGGTQKKINQTDIDGEDKFPKIYINKDIINNNNKTYTDRNVNRNIYGYVNDVVYSINGEFYKVQNQPLKYQVVCIYAKKMDTPNFFKMFDTDERYCALPDSDEENSDDDIADESDFLAVTLLKLPHGVIINSSVYLPIYQWNTLVFYNVKNVRCFVCDESFHFNDCASHISNDMHEKALSSCKPLQMFDLSIIRQIVERYHCAVCNEVFDIEEVDDHNAAKSHENNYLFAINKALDIFVDGDHTRDSKKTECYHFDADALNNRQHEDCNSISDDIIDDDVVDDDDDEIVDNENDLFMGMSYAAMTKKPTIKLPKYVYKSNGNKQFRVTVESWHMVLILKNNKFYCMVCKYSDHIGNKSKHCMGADHVGNLDKCKVLPAYTSYLIRQVDEKKVHCAHCNNLEFNYQIEEHLESWHSRAGRNVIQDAMPSTSQVVNNNTGNAYDKVTNGYISIGNPARNTNIPITFDGSDRYINEVNKVNKIENINCDSLYSNIVLNVFNYNMRVQMISFHVVCEKVDHYLCGLCDMKESKDRILCHIESVMHVSFLHAHPFIPQFGCHLLRDIRGAFHCGLCNIPIIKDDNVIRGHVQDPNHLLKLNLALGIKAPVNVLPDLKQNMGKPDAVNMEDAKTTVSVDETVDVINRSELIANNIDLDTNVIVKNDNKTKLETNIKDVALEIETPLNVEAKVFVKLDADYYKVTLTSYNSLVATGSGSRHCFVCSTEVDFEHLQRHIESRDHEKNLEECKFLDSYKNHLIRQSYLTYHCALCNIIIYRSDLPQHLEWPHHNQIIEENAAISRKQRKNLIKSGFKLYTLSCQKEIIYRGVKEPHIHYHLVAEIVHVPVKKNKIVIVYDNVLKVNWSAWNGITMGISAYKCLLCQEQLFDVNAHVKTVEHVKNTKKSFIEQYYPALLREVNSELINCIICNNEVPNKDITINNHTNGKRHLKNYANLLNESSKVNAYENCDEDVLII